ncbi:Methyltransferase type 11 [Beutenbergia cavernae DSM 12333]|uniref:Methyltransferase type 11 n=1 Tax=Beutenbergia cavernae (strain ATCC BAA-8 / DSM 12333 / CCUG 43141 / JCM 11478 / NBRC 16432 / NCIMB 13614 / HKI 0122) TaxID=471853 RepID=C5C620_BEUC1|nr:class I SAM-dependent methyltransferase [Beutenbergia cavernae]ACQ82378.1 Methyltransferase type 11 [Beutenbergia cavernae DSM 12333]
MSIWNLDQRDLWGADAAASYDTPGEGMFAPDVLGPTLDRLHALSEGGRVLELAIGTGRVGVPLRERGADVSGIELSEAMVDVLRTKATEEELPVVVGDMATARVPGDFSLVYLVFNTISNLYTQEAQVACFRNAAAHLAPGGRFLVELWVPRPQPVTGGRHAQVFTAEDGYLGVDVLDMAHQRVVSHHIHFDDDGAARVWFSPHRFIWPGELDLMARLAGMELESRHADFAGAPFTSDSPSHVSVYRLPERPAD